MYGKMQEYLSQTLAEIKEAGLYKEERLIESAQLPSRIISRQKIRFCTQLASMPTGVYSNRFSAKRMPLSPIL